MLLASFSPFSDDFLAFSLAHCVSVLCFYLFIDSARSETPLLLRLRPQKCHYGLRFQTHTRRISRPYPSSSMCCLFSISHIRSVSTQSLFFLPLLAFFHGSRALHALTIRSSPQSLSLSISLALVPACARAFISLFMALRNVYFRLLASDSAVVVTIRCVFVFPPAASSSFALFFSRSPGQPK